MAGAADEFFFGYAGCRLATQYSNERTAATKEESEKNCRATKYNRQVCDA